MTFIQRLANQLFDIVISFVFAYGDRQQFGNVREHFGQDIPDVIDTNKDRSVLAIVNSHFVTHGV